MCEKTPAEVLYFSRQQRRLLGGIFALLLLSCFLPGGLLPRRVNNYVSKLSEVLDVYSPTSPMAVLPGGPRTLDDIHGKGLHHKGSIMVAVDDEQRILLLWRSHAAITCPSTWSLIGEHVLTGESFETAAGRGVDEEVPFLGEVDMRPLGRAALIVNRFETRLGKRIDKQWTRFFIVTSSFFSVDFSEILKGVPAVHSDLGKAQGVPAAPIIENVENTRMLGMSLMEVVRLAVGSKSFLCDEVQRTWLLRVISVVGIVLNEHKHVRSLWQGYKLDNAPVFCRHSEDGKPTHDIDLRQCGVSYEQRGRSVQIIQNK